MNTSGWPRHQLRAQGRLRWRSADGCRKNSDDAQPQSDLRRTGNADSITKSSQLLNFLSKTAAQAERSLLQPVLVPDFAFVKNSEIGCDLNDIAAAKRQQMSPEPVTKPLVEVPSETAEGVLGRLATTIAEEASEILCADDRSYELEFAIVSDEHQRLSCASGQAMGNVWEPDLNASDCVADLDNWFNCSFDPTGGDTDYLVDYEAEPLERQLSNLLPAALPPVLDEADQIEREVTSRDIPDDARTSMPRRKTVRSRRDRRQLFRRLMLDQPQIAGLAEGERIERFDNGAQLKKDALGRVTDIRSGLGTSICVSYDKDGQPQGFMRSDRNGLAHSLGERDRHGVVVRDTEGRVRAAGESMSVDPNGCLSVRRFDGQFWSLDLVKGLHIERRSIVGSDGSWNFLTAVFAADGFRMVTRFQSLKGDTSSNVSHAGPAGDRFHWLAAEPSGTFRFYGRDGSVIQFQGEDDLSDLNPEQVWAPGSRAVEAIFRGRHQAGTAWDSVQEYVTSYLWA